jgi:hypothetical protein
MSTDEMPEKPKRVQKLYVDKPEARIAGALALIGMGVVFLLQQNNLLQLDNWWALFILVPGGISLVYGLVAYRGGKRDHQTRGSITAGTLMMVIGLIFVLELDWGRIWPVFLIIPGVFMLLGLNRPEDA